MSTITGKIAILDDTGNVVSDQDLGTVIIKVDDGKTLPLIEITPTLTENQVLNTYSYVVDTSNGVVNKIWSSRDLGPADFPLSSSQLRLGLVRNGIPLSNVANIIASIPNSERQDEAQVWWEYSTWIHWDHPETQLLMNLLNIPTSSLVAMWMQAKDYK